jgi:cyanophycinase
MSKILYTFSKQTPVKLRNVILLSGGSMLQSGFLMPIGGAEDKVHSCTILKCFVELCGGANAKIVVMPVASQFAAESGPLYCDLFRRLGAGDARCIQIIDRSQSNNPAHFAALNDATGIFFTGGDQLKLITLIGATRLGKAVRSRHQAGVHVAGTSAGASAMSRQMIAFGRSGSIPLQRMVQIASGLGLVESLVIDQHFTQRDRLGRLLTAVTLNPGLTGIGIDEDTALLIAPTGEAQVLGSGTVTIADNRNPGYTNIHTVKRYDPITVEGIDITVLPSGACYPLELFPMHSQEPAPEF